MGLRMRIRMGLMLIVVACATAGLTPATSFGLTEHPFIGSFGGEATPAGSFGDPNGLATDEASGDLYVADAAKQVVDKVDATGAAVNFESLGTSALDGSATPAGSFAFQTKEVFTPAGIAVDNDAISPSFEDIYVLDSGHDVIDKFKPNGEYVSQLTGTPGGPFATDEAGEGPFGVAVDTGGNVLVYETNGVVDKFNATGAFQSQFSTECTHPNAGLAVNSVGDVYILCEGAVEKISPTGTLIETLPGAGQATAVAVDEANDHVFEAHEATLVREFDAAGAEISQSHPKGALEGEAAGVAVREATGEIFMSNGVSQKVYHWGPLITLPDVETREATGVEPEAATLNGVVNPDEIEVAACEFEYGLTTAYGKKAKCSPEPGAGGAEVEVSATVEELEPDTTYHYRLIATNTSGSNPGADTTFTTTGAPTVDEQGSRETTQTGTVLEGQVNPHGFATTYHFEYGETTAYGTSIPVPDGELGPETFDQAVSAEITGLRAGVRYHFRLVASNAQGVVDGPDNTVTTVPPAEISDVSATALSATGATLNAMIDPLGNDTTYHFEYGTSTGYGKEVPVLGEDIGAENTAVSVSQTISGLTAGMTYHFRVVAVNSLGTATGVDHTFVFDTSTEGLPDGRAYELVTPTFKNGTRIGHFFQSFVPVFARDGERAIMPTIQCFGEAQSCNADRGLSVGTPYTFGRTGSGWQASSLAPSAAQFGVGPGAYRMSADLNTALFSIPETPGSQDDWYAVRGSAGAVERIGPITPPADGPHGPPVRGSFGLTATADLSHVVFTLEKKEERWPFDTTVGRGQTLYEYSQPGSEPELVAVTGGHGSTNLISTCDARLATVEAGYNALSADGETVFFTADAPQGSEPCVGPPADELYARVDQDKTVPLSERSSLDCTTTACTTSVPADANFGGASEDGGMVYFTSTQELTDEANEDGTPGDKATDHAGGNHCQETTGRNGCNLYLYDFAAPEGHNLIDVSAGSKDGHGPRVRGVVAISSDGSHVYFVAQGVLTGELNANGEAALAGADNLYVYERDAAHPEGHVTFIADLASSDGEEWGMESPGTPANVTPDGHFLVFLSHRALTPDDTRAEGPSQVYRYDALTDSLVRVSIGANGFNDDGNAGTEDAGILAPREFTEVAAGATRPDPTMSDDGAYVFFESPVGLTRQALDDTVINAGGTLADNIYEYHNGQVSLISDGRDTSAFLGLSGVKLLAADSTGANVFFTSADQLVPQDTDTQFDVYDARIGGGFPLPPSPVDCQGDECREPSQPAPTLETPASESFSGPGSVAAAPAVKTKVAKKAVKCKRGFVKNKRNKCVKKPKKKSKAKKSNHGKRSK
jgi:hypothetical protein